jgi:hypothetical protein
MQPMHPKSDARGLGATIAAVAPLLVALLVAQVIFHSVATAADPDPARAARLNALAADQASVRQTIAGLQPADAALESLTKATAAADKPLLDASIAARKKAAEAGNAFLVLLVPETNPVEIEVQRDGWIRIQNELELANLAHTLANERNRMAIGRGAEQAAAAVRIPDIVKRDDERLAARKALLEANLQLRIAERNRRCAGGEFEKALRTP